jgi:hypothetical protein
MHQLRPTTPTGLDALLAAIPAHTLEPVPAGTEPALAPKLARIRHRRSHTEGNFDGARSPRPLRSGVRGRVG